MKFHFVCYIHETRKEHKTAARYISTHARRDTLQFVAN